MTTGFSTLTSSMAFFNAASPPGIDFTFDDPRTSRAVAVDVAGQPLHTAVRNILSAAGLAPVVLNVVREVPPGA